MGLRVFVFGLFAVSAFGAAPSADTIVQRSVQAIKRDWVALPQYDKFERDLEDHGSKTYQILMVLGSPYRRLVQVNGTPLSADDQRKEQEKLDQAVAQRCAESPDDRRKRIDDYRRNRERDQQMMSQLTKGFSFKLEGRKTVNGRATWVLDATPRPGYQPPTLETRALTGMRGKLWIDQATYQWVKVEAWVFQPVQIEGFLATVEPGTRFELTKAPGPDGLWFPTHFSERSKSEVLAFIGHTTHDDETYFDYQPAGSVKIPGCSARRAER